MLMLKGKNVINSSSGDCGILYKTLDAKLLKYKNGSFFFFQNFYFQTTSVKSIHMQTCHSSRFNRDIPIFQYKSRPIPISRVKIPSFCFVSKLEKQKVVSLCCMARVSKPTKFWLKINAMIG